MIIKIYGVCDSGYTTPFIQEVRARPAKASETYITDGKALCFNEHVYVKKEEAALSSNEAQRRWSEALIKKAEELEEKARHLRERATLKLKTVPA